MKRAFCLLAGFMVLISGTQSCRKLDFIRRHSDGVIRCRVDGVATKATPITTESIKEFGMECYADAEFHSNYKQDTPIPAGFYFSGKSTKSSGGAWGFSNLNRNTSVSDDYKEAGTGDIYWLNDVSMSFWSKAPLTTNGEFTSGSSSLYGSDESAKKYVFSYTLPAHTTANNDATDQDDLIFAYNNEKRVYNDEGILTSTTSNGVTTNNPKEEDDEAVNIHFYHAMAEVNFCVGGYVSSASLPHEIATHAGEYDGEFDTSFGIRSISLVDVPSSGTCEFLAAKATEATLALNGKTGAERDATSRSKVGNIFKWTPSSVGAVYTQSYSDVKFPASSTDAVPSSTDWTPGIYTKDGTHFFGKYTCTNSFMMIPHTLGAGAMIRVVLDSGDVVEASICGDIWEPGKYYTYKLSVQLGEEIKFSVKLVDWDVQDVELDF